MSLLCYETDSIRCRKQFWETYRQSGPFFLVCKPCKLGSFENYTTFAGRKNGEVDCLDLLLQKEWDNRNLNQIVQWIHELDFFGDQQLLRRWQELIACAGIKVASYSTSSAVSCTIGRSGLRTYLRMPTSSTVITLQRAERTVVASHAVQEDTAQTLYIYIRTREICLTFWRPESDALWKILWNAKECDSKRTATKLVNMIQYVIIQLLALAGVQRWAKTGRSASQAVTSANSHAASS